MIVWLEFSNLIGKDLMLSLSVARCLSSIDALLRFLKVQFQQDFFFKLDIIKEVLEHFDILIIRFMWMHN